MKRGNFSSKSWLIKRKISVRVLAKPSQLKPRLKSIDLMNSTKRRRPFTTLLTIARLTKVI